jgi:hypothetical protein
MERPMTNRQPPSPLDVAGAVTGTLVALGTVVMAAFPFALPLLALTAVAAIPFLLLALALGIVTALLAATALLARRLAWRTSRSRRRRRLHADTTTWSRSSSSEARVVIAAR